MGGSGNGGGGTIIPDAEQQEDPKRSEGQAGILRTYLPVGSEAGFSGVNGAWGLRQYKRETGELSGIGPPSNRPAGYQPAPQLKRSYGPPKRRFRQAPA